MKLICVSCGNYVHFEAQVEGLQVIEVSPGGLVIGDRDQEGAFDTGSWIRMGLQDLVDYCVKMDLEALRWDSSSGGYINPHISCARCGSKRVCVPYRDWSPPRENQFLDEEICENRQEYSWLRKERRHADSVPSVR